MKTVLTLLACLFVGSAYADQHQHSHGEGESHSHGTESTMPGAADAHAGTAKTEPAKTADGMKTMAKAKAKMKAGEKKEKMKTEGETTAE